MAEYPKAMLTNSGLDMIAQSQTGEQLIFTKVILGDGQLDGQSIEDLTEVLVEKMQVPLQGIKQVDVGQVRIRFVFTSDAVESNFFVREIGLYAKIGEEGTEQLYAYTNAGNLADYLSKDNVGDETMIDIDVVVGSAVNVTAIIDSAFYATTKDLKEHDTDPNAHSGMLKGGGFAIGQTTMHLGTTPPPGFLELNGAEISRATYPSLWEWVQTQQGLLAEENEWQSEKVENKECGFYSTGNGLTTFRLPLINSFVRAKGTSVRKIGEFEVDDFKSHTHTALTDIRTVSNSSYGKVHMVGGQDVLPIEETGGTETRPKSITFLCCVKAFDASIDQGAIDLTELVNEVNALKNSSGFAIGQTTMHLGETPPPGFLELNGKEIGRATYPSLWEWIQTQTGLLMDETAWQQEKVKNGECGFYSLGDGIKTFRLPLINSFARAKGNSKRAIGEFELDGFKEHSHRIKGVVADHSNGTYPNVGHVNGNAWEGINNHDTESLVVGGDETHPKSITFLYCVKAYDGYFNKGLVDLAGKVDYTDYTQLFEENGWCKLPNGLIFQWGKTNTTKTAGTSVTLPVAFPNTCLSAYATAVADENMESSRSYAVSTNGTEKDKIRIGIAFASNGGASDAIVRWFAIGF